MSSRKFNDMKRKKGGKYPKTPHFHNISINNDHYFHRLTRKARKEEKKKIKHGHAYIVLWYSNTPTLSFLVRIFFLWMTITHIMVLLKLKSMELRRVLFPNNLSGFKYMNLFVFRYFFFVVQRQIFMQYFMTWPHTKQLH